MLGDSFVLGVGVPIEATFAAVLERALNGYGAAQELLLLRRTV